MQLVLAMTETLSTFYLSTMSGMLQQNAFDLRLICFHCLYIFKRKRNTKAKTGHMTKAPSSSQWCK